MNLIPQKKIIYTTKLTKEEIIDRLNTNFQYDGYVSDDYFFIQRYVSGRGKILIPQITGVYHENSDGTTINVVMKIKKPILIFMTVLMIGISFASAIIIHSMILSMTFDTIIISPLALFLFVVSILIISFQRECHQSKRHLQKIFKAEISD